MCWQMSASKREYFMGEFCRHMAWYGYHVWVVPMPAKEVILDFQI